MKSQKAQKSKSSRPGLPFSLSLPADLQSKAQKLQLVIARRAHELFEARGREHGHDLEDWLRAESELLCPVSIAMSESKNRVSVRANVAGFDQSEIEVSVEPSRVIILGKKTHSTRTTEPGTTEPRGSHPDQILEVIDLATEVIPERVVVEWKEGELIVELPAVSKNRTAACTEPQMRLDEYGGSDNSSLVEPWSRRSRERNSITSSAGSREQGIRRKANWRWWDVEETPRGDMVNGLMCSLWAGEEGQDIAEYAVMLAVILVVVVGTLRLIGSNTNNVFSRVASTLQ